MQSVMIEITAVDRKSRALSGKDKSGKDRTFFYGRQTRLRKLAPTELTTMPFVAVIANENEPFPLRIDQEVLVMWRLDTATGKALAVEFVTYE